MGTKSVGHSTWLTREDSDIDGEQRFITLGMGSKGRILIVVGRYAAIICV